MTKDEAQHSRWTFYEVVKDSLNLYHTTSGNKDKDAHEKSLPVTGTHLFVIFPQTFYSFITKGECYKEGGDNYGN